MKFSRFLAVSIAAIGLSVSANAADLRVGLKSEPSSIDPHYHNLGPNNGFTTHIFGTWLAVMKPATLSRPCYIMETSQ